MATLTVDMRNVHSPPKKKPRKYAQTPAGTSTHAKVTRSPVSISTSMTTPMEGSAFDVAVDDDQKPGGKHVHNGYGGAVRSNSARRSQKYKPETFGALFEAENNNGGGGGPRLMTLNNSTSIQNASIALDDCKHQITSEICAGFTGFHSTLNERQSRLVSELQSTYEDKKNDIIAIERKLFLERGKKTTKTGKTSKEAFAFDANIAFVLNKPKCVRQIEKFGCFQHDDDDGANGSDSDGDKNNGSKREAGDIFKRKLKLTNKTSSSLSQLHAFSGDDDAKIGPLKDGDDEDDEGSGSDDDAGRELSTAQKQKLVLGEIQLKTMSKLDTVVLMEREARRKKKQAGKLEIEVKEALKYIAERTKIINEKLEEARPELDKARQAASGINPKDLNEIKTLKSPPKVVENVMTATVMLLGHPIKVWGDVKKLLSYRFKPELLNFDTYTLTKETRQKVYKKYASNEDFSYDRVLVASKVCGNLVLWCQSQINYSRTLDVIIPLEKEVKKLQKDAKKKEKLAKELLRLVQELQVNIEEYTKQCNEMIEHIIKSTDHELQQFSDKLAPLNEKFNALLNNKNLEK